MMLYHYTLVFQLINVWTLLMAYLGMTISSRCPLGISSVMKSFELCQIYFKLSSSTMVLMPTNDIYNKKVELMFLL